VTGSPGPWRVASRLRILEAVCLLVALTAFAWLVTGRVAAARDQANWARELEAQLAARGSLPAEAGSHPTQAAFAGRLEIPRLGLSVMTREGTDPATLDRAVGHIANTARPGASGNAAFAGHRDTFFSGLRHVRAGDRVVVTTDFGRYEYIVRETRVVSPRDVSVLDPTPEPTLTLVTCFPFRYIGPAPERFIVRASLAQDAAR
jgi:sortase A